MNWKTLASFLWLLETNWKLQQFKTYSKDFHNSVIFCREISPKYGNGRIKVCFSTGVIWGRFMTSLLIIILKHFSINVKGYPSFKGSATHDHFLFEVTFHPYHGQTYHGYHKYILEINENFSIKLDRSVLNKNISSAKLFLFDNN